jgi:hypothetical protein
VSRANEQSMGIKVDGADVSPTASTVKAAPPAGDVTVPGVLSTSPIKFSKEDLVYLATSGPTIAIKRGAAEALYQRGRVDAAHEIRTAIGAP